MNKTILITAFDPFGGESINPSWEACKKLNENFGEYEVVKFQIPTVFDKAGSIVIEKIKEINPSFVFMLGQAGGRKDVTPEKLAINYKDARIFDNEGNMPQNEKIEENGKDGIFTNVNIFEIAKKMKEEGHNISISLSAGSFVCNDTFYKVASYLQNTDVKYDFIHVPFIPSQVKNNENSLELSEIVDTLNCFIANAVK